MIWRLTCELNDCGRLSSRMRASSGVRSPLRLLHGRQQATRFSHPEEPPRERGTTWSSVRSCGGAARPQYWHVLWSRRRMFLRERLLRSNGMWMYSSSRMTDGAMISVDGECRTRSDASSTRAEPFRISTTARRIEHTLIGSNEALRTKTLPSINSQVPPESF